MWRGGGRKKGVEKKIRETPLKGCKVDCGGAKEIGIVLRGEYRDCMELGRVISERGAKKKGA